MVETGTGGSPRSFPSTRWSLILSARDPGSSACREALNHLCGLYWKPVFCYIRTTRSMAGDDAKDATQDFFADVIEGGLLERFSPERGSFRGYLKGAIRLFLLERHEKSSALKRGGARTSVPLDDRWIETAAVGRDGTPEDAFERQWARSVMDSALSDLRDELRRGGKERHWTIFERYELSAPSGASPTYADLAREVGVKTTDVTNYLNHCRARLRALCLGRVRDYIADESDAAAELMRLFELLRS
ncbi:MAG: sigma-70 family RNA polymerase sigma factor [Planctomycetes bacterium]|nr:sigma-70 family RNA polymerase sigma factor [Planctomycetota bacterium]